MELVSICAGRECYYSVAGDTGRSLSELNISTSWSNATASVANTTNSSVSELCLTTTVSVQIEYDPLMGGSLEDQLTRAVGNYVYRFQTELINNSSLSEANTTSNSTNTSNSNSMAAAEHQCDSTLMCCPMFGVEIASPPPPPLFPPIAPPPTAPGLCHCRQQSPVGMQASALATLLSAMVPVPLSSTPSCASFINSSNASVNLTYNLTYSPPPPPVFPPIAPPTTAPYPPYNLTDNATFNRRLSTDEAGSGGGGGEGDSTPPSLDCGAMPEACVQCPPFAYCLTTPDANCANAPSMCTSSCVPYVGCLAVPPSPPIDADSAPLMDSDMDGWQCNLMDLNAALRNGFFHADEVLMSTDMRSACAQPNVRMCTCDVPCTSNEPPVATLEVQHDNSAILRFSEPVLSTTGEPLTLRNTNLTVFIDEGTLASTAAAFDVAAIQPLDGSLAASVYWLNLTWRVEPYGDEALHVNIHPFSVIGIYGGLMNTTHLVGAMLDKQPPTFSPSLAIDEGLTWFPPNTVRRGKSAIWFACIH